jgi:hypothetical protein
VRSGASVSSSDSALDPADEEVSSDSRRVKVLDTSVMGTCARRLLGRERMMWSGRTV